MSMFNKPTINVIINTNGLPNTYSKKHSDGTVTYGGLFYDVYRDVRDSLKDKYDFKETYDTDFSVSATLDGIRDGKYDIGINNFSTTITRLKDVDFPRSIILERDVIVYKEKPNSTLNLVWTLMRDVFFVPIIVVISVGFLIGTIMFYLQKNRKPGIPKKLWYRRSVLATIATFLGEAGMMAEESPLGSMAILTTVIIMSFSIAFNSYLTASVTDKILETNMNSVYNIQSMPKMNLLAQTGQSVGANFR